MSNEIVTVSVVMPVYNHEKYLEEAIQSVVEQETNFKIELLIGEDCSTDASATICKEYEALYPDLVTVFYREKNLGALENSYDLLTKAQGKYIIALEGDDYWTDKSKLQKQVDFLESHTEYVACCHKFQVVDENGKAYYDRDFECQFFEDKIYTFKEFEKGYLASHINTILYLNVFKDETIETEFFHKFNNVLCDITIMALLVSIGNIYCMNENMSCYRKVIATNACNFNSKLEKNNFRDEIFKSQMFLEKRFNHKISFTNRKKAVFASAVFKWYRDRTEENFKVVKNIIKFSEETIKYWLYFTYLVVAKKIVNMIYKEDRRIAF